MLDWEKQYINGTIPWDIPYVHQSFQTYFNSIKDRNIKILDIGCGTGTTAIWLAKLGFSVTGIDISPKAIELSIRKSISEGVHCTFLVDNFLNTKLKNSSFDIVIDSSTYRVFEEEDRQIFARNVSKVLKPKGIWLSVTATDESASRILPTLPKKTLDMLISSTTNYFTNISVTSSSYACTGLDFWTILFINNKSEIKPKIVDHEERMMICKKCPNLQTFDRCNICGCFMVVKVRIKGTSCPINNW